MIMIERMVLLLLEAAPSRRLQRESLQSVCSILNKRYSLRMEHSLENFDEILKGLDVLYFDQTKTGFQLNSGGDAELEQMRRKQGPFVAMFGKIARNIFNRDIVARSIIRATVRVQVPARACV